MSATASHRFSLYGLGFDSALAFPGLPPALSDEPADVVIEIGSTPARLDPPVKEGVCYQTTPRELLIWLEGVARFLVTDGRAIRVEPEPGADLTEVRRLLLSSPLGALLLQRGLLAFHASAVAREGAGVLFLGGPCAGKSTAAAQLRARGFRLLADDLAAVKIDAQGQPWILPGPAEQKLWPDSLTALGHDRAAFPRVRADLRKRLVPIPERGESAAVALRAVYVLETHRAREAAIGPSHGQSRITALLHHTYRLGFLAGAEPHARHFSAIARLAQAVKIASLGRAEAGVLGEEIVRQIEEELRG